jgi:hypothetical protein
MKQRTAKRNQVMLAEVPAEVLAGTELGKKTHIKKAPCGIVLTRRAICLEIEA